MDERVEGIDCICEDKESKWHSSNCIANQLSIVRICNRKLQAALASREKEIEELKRGIENAEKIANNESSVLTVHILRNWDREKIERFCLHLLGEDWQTLKQQLQDRDKVIEGMREALGKIANTASGTQMDDWFIEIAKAALKQNEEGK